METAVKVLVTSGSGRIGRYVVRELVEAGHEVTSVDVGAQCYGRMPLLDRRSDRRGAGV